MEQTEIFLPAQSGDQADSVSDILLSERVDSISEHAGTGKK